ncbi:hypothetical protein Misp03_75920 [Microbispora sp. NBRC 16548]|nr:hypothetical protein Misp03_75920 [Microbispora sp. NBRC 16548]
MIDVTPPKVSGSRAWSQQTPQVKYQVSMAVPNLSGVRGPESEVARRRRRPTLQASTGVLNVGGVRRAQRTFNAGPHITSLTTATEKRSP